VRWKGGGRQIQMSVGYRLSQSLDLRLTLYNRHNSLSHHAFTWGRKQNQASEALRWTWTPDDRQGPQTRLLQTMNEIYIHKLHVETLYELSAITLSYFSAIYRDDLESRECDIRTGLWCCFGHSNCYFTRCLKAPHTLCHLCPPPSSLLPSGVSS
jgi:hypothetical protein